jgi:hypothetical protein
MNFEIKRNTWMGYGEKEPQYYGSPRTLYWRLYYNFMAKNPPSIIPENGTFFIKVETTWCPTDLTLEKLRNFVRFDKTLKTITTKIKLPN